MKTENSSKDKTTDRGWFGWRLAWNQAARGGRFIRSTAISLFVPAQATLTESFEEALVRLHLTENDIADRIKSFRRLFIIFLTASSCLFGYALFMLYIENSYSVALACFGLTAFLIGQAFRYHFWLFQMKRRKLGCSFKEWMKEGLLNAQKRLQ
jgi:intracellular multiplication protein IcmV